VALGEPISSPVSFFQAGDAGDGLVGILPVSENERFQIGELLAKRRQTGIAHAAAAEAGAFEVGPALKVLERRAGHRRADKAKRLQLL